MQAYASIRNAAYEHEESTDYVNSNLRKLSPTRYPENDSRNRKEEVPDIGTGLRETQVG